MFFPPVVNRDLLLVRPREPYWRWAAAVEGMTPEAVKAELEGGAQAWLIRESRADRLDEAWLKKHYKTIFEEHLEAWCTDEELWPSPRPYARFKEWFEWEYHQMVLDLCKENLERE